MHYQISNTVSGAALGYWPGESACAAVEAMTRDAGYASRQEAAETLGMSVEEADSEVLVEAAPNVEICIRHGWVKTVTDAGAVHLVSTVIAYDEALPADSGEADWIAIGQTMAREHLATVRR